MKTQFLILTMILFMMYSCEKKSDHELPENPSNDIYFGYYTSGHSVEFSNQDSIFAKTMDSIVTIKIAEKNLRLTDLNISTPSDLNFAIQISSLEDNELIIKGKNVWSLGTAIGQNSQREITSISHVFVVPVKFSDTIKKNNDTLELKTTNDYIRVLYKSDYTKLNTEDTLKLK